MSSDIADYKTHDPRGWCGDPKRGAALGRPRVQDAPDNYSGKLTVRKVPLDSGGYDPNGTYFGHGTPIYWVANAEGSIDYTMRAHDRREAVARARVEYPNAKIRKEPARGASHGPVCGRIGCTCASKRVCLKNSSGYSARFNLVARVEVLWAEHRILSAQATSEARNAPKAKPKKAKVA